ncbi:MAG: hypothetical protein HY234_00490 [Acidobacteria bacterium]|nr:hypothetical protein [Acidobacteriota bacterium]
MKKLFAFLVVAILGVSAAGAVPRRGGQQLELARVRASGMVRTAEKISVPGATVRNVPAFSEKGRKRGGHKQNDAPGRFAGAPSVGGSGAEND